MRRKIYSSTSSESNAKATLKKMYKDAVEQGTVPKIGSVVKTTWDGYNEYWRVVCPGGLNSAIDDYLMDYYEDGLDLEEAFNDIIYNQIFLSSLPRDPEGGIPFGEVDSWEYSSREEAKNDNYGRV